MTPTSRGYDTEATSPPSNDAVSSSADKVHAQVCRARADELIARLRTNAIAGPLPSGYLVWLLWAEVDHAQLLAWWSALFIIDMVSVIHGTVYLRRAERVTKPIWWVGRQVASQTLAGFTWGSSMFWYTATGEANSDILLVLVGAYALSSMNLLHYRLAPVVYTAAFWLLPALVLVIEGGGHGRRIAFGLPVLVISIVIYITDVSKQLSTGLEKRYQAQHLAVDLRESAAKIEQLASYDELCGCLNRRSGMEKLRIYVSQPVVLTALMVDADHFKAVNDVHGHQAGDSVLRELAKRLNSGLRQADFVARIGGEEFLVVMPQTAVDEARKVADRLSGLVNSQPITHHNLDIPVTVSIGLACRQPGESAEVLLGRADAALYQAKANGRNRVEVAPTAARRANSLGGSHVTKSSVPPRMST